MEINRQRNNTTTNSVFDDWKQPEVTHALEKRKEVAQMICQDLSNLEKNEEMEHRTSVGAAVFALCQKIKPPRKSWD